MIIQKIVFIDFHYLVLLILLPSSILLNYQVLLFLATENYMNSLELKRYLAKKHEVEVLVLVLT